MEIKICVKCQVKKSITCFNKSKNRKDGLQPYCKSCRKIYSNNNKDKLSEYHRVYRNKETYKKWHEKYVESNKEEIKKKHKDYEKKIKAEVFSKYGGFICSCCGEKEESFLVIDHIHGGGTQHRKTLKGGGGKATYYWLRKNNYPEGFRVLCHNCNWGIHVNGGICPHKSRVQK